jgi:hypothetical protein
MAADFKMEQQKAESPQITQMNADFLKAALLDLE